jgi:hypothetical protein
MGDGGTISITGGHVESEGGIGGAAGIGGGAWDERYPAGTSGGTITINYPDGNSTGTAVSVLDEYAIGPGNNGSGGSFNGVEDDWPADNPYIWVSQDINLSSPPANTAAGSGWRYYEGVYTIKNNAALTVSGSTENDRIIVNGTATITLDDATITTNDSPITLESGAGLTIRLAGTNTLTPRAAGNAGISVPEGTTLTITSADGDGETTGSLSATGNHGPGIGGGGTINIKGGAITATGGAESAGIGSGSNGTITITGGVVTASSPDWDGDPAGIGGGSFGACGDITITGGSGTATGGGGGAKGVGPGWDGAYGTFTGKNNSHDWPTDNPYTW